MTGALKPFDPEKPFTIYIGKYVMFAILPILLTQQSKATVTLMLLLLTETTESLLDANHNIGDLLFT